MPSESSFLKVRDFYLTRYRPLYDHFVTNGEVPQELPFVVFRTECKFWK